MAEWKKGQSGNPKGRPKTAAIIRELAKRDQEEFYFELSKLARLVWDGDAKLGKLKLDALVKALELAGVSFSPEAVAGAMESANGRARLIARIAQAIEHVDTDGDPPKP